MEKNENVLDLKSEIQLLEGSLNEIEGIYNKEIEFYEGMKGARGSLAFLSNQLKNLIDLKRSKLDIIKEMIAAKRSIAEFNLKSDKNVSTDEQQIDTINKIMQKLLNSSTHQQINIVNSNQNIDIDKELDSRYEELKNNKVIEEVTIESNSIMDNKDDEVEEDNYEEDIEDFIPNIVVLLNNETKYWKFVVVDENNNIRENTDIELPDKKSSKLKLKKNELGYTYAEDVNTGAVYDVMKE